MSDERDLRPVRAIRLTHTEDFWIYDAVNIWHLRGNRALMIKRNVGRHTFSLFRAGSLVREFDTLTAAQERGIEIDR